MQEIRGENYFFYLISSHLLRKFTAKPRPGRDLNGIRFYKLKLMFSDSGTSTSIGGSSKKKKKSKSKSRSSRGTSTVGRRTSGSPSKYGKSSADRKADTETSPKGSESRSADQPGSRFESRSTGSEERF